MALKTTWNHSDTSNRVITEPLCVKYTSSELYYDIAPKGDGSKPSYVTDAESALDAAKTNLSTQESHLTNLETQMTSAKTALNSSYSTWYANRTLESFRAYCTASNTYGTVKDNYKQQESVVNSAIMAVNNATKALDDANERWAKESETVEYKGGRFLGWEHHRIATMRMHYVGFSYSAAASCKAYFDDIYTRYICKSASFNNGVPEIIHQRANPSTVRMVKKDGDNYDIEIEVSEDDVRLSTYAAVSSTLFVVENNRVYL